MPSEHFHTVLSKRIVSNPDFGRDCAELFAEANRSELGLKSENRIAQARLAKLLQAAAILACSCEDTHRQIANDLAAVAASFVDTSEVDDVARVVLARLGNFPSRDLLARASNMPVQLVVEGERLLDDASISVVDKRFPLTRFQKKFWHALEAGKDVFVSAPTSAGKSYVMKLFLASKVVESNQWCLYLAPTRALVRQVATDISARIFDMGIHNAEVLTSAGESIDDTRGVFVLTQERLNSLLEREDCPEFSTVFVDEVQGLGDGHRGVLLWEVIDELRRRQPEVQLVLATPGAGDSNSVKGLAGNTPLSIASDLRPVRATIHRVNVRGRRASIAIEGDKATLTELAVAGAPLAAAAVRFGMGRQNIVYASSPGQCESTANKILSIVQTEEVSEQRAELAAFIRAEIHEEYRLATLVEAGIGFHYGRLPGVLRTAIEDALGRGVLEYVVCTSTLLQGVNLPARNVFIGSPKKGKVKLLDGGDFWNLAGRAGRLGFDLVGNVFLINSAKWEHDPSLASPHVRLRPTFSRILMEHAPEMLSYAESTDLPSGVRENSTFETALTSLFLAQREERLPRLWAQVTGSDQVPSETALGRVVKKISEDFSLPTKIVHGNRGISPYRQEEAWNLISTRVQNGQQLVTLIPVHPLASGAYERLKAILKFIHTVFEKLPKGDRSHEFFALAAQKWMQGESISQMVAGRISYYKESPSRAVNAVFKLIENDLRFRYVKYVKCYSDILREVLVSTGHSELAQTIPAIPLYLELGASNTTAISMLNLGLSRTTANHLARRAPLDLDEKGALSWIRTTDLSGLGVSAVCIREARSLLGASGR